MVEKEVKFKSPVFFANLNINLYGGREGLKPKDYGLDEWPEDWEPGSFNKIDSHWRKFLQSFKNKTLAELKKYSYPTPIKNVIAIPQSKKDYAIKVADDGEAKFWEHIGEFKEDLPAMFESREEKYAGQPWWERVKEDYPTPTTVGKHFGYKLFIFNLIPSSGDEEALKIFNEGTKEMAEMWLQHIRGRLIESLTNLSQKITSGELRTDKSINAVKNAIDWYKELNQFGVSELDSKIDELVGQLNGVNRDSLKDNLDLQDKLAMVCDQVAKAADNIEDIKAVAEAYVRSVEY